MKTNNDLQTLMQNWLLTDKKERIADKTFNQLYGISQHYIYPYIGNMPVAQIDSNFLERFFYEELYKNKGVSYGIMRKIKYLLSDFFNHIIKEQILSDSPIAQLSLGKFKPSRKNETPDKKQMDKFFEAILTHRLWKPFCFTIILTGLRISEILALKWRDVDFKKKIIHVNNRVNAKFDFNTDGSMREKKFVIEPLNRPRNIPLMDLTEAILKDHKKFRKRQQNYRKNQYSYTSEDDLVFGNKKSELRSYTGITHNLRRILKFRGLEDLKITFSSLRRYFMKMSMGDIEKLYEMNNALIKIKEETAMKRILHRYKNKSKIEIIEM